jgi:hypothetical protein
MVILLIHLRYLAKEIRGLPPFEFGLKKGWTSLAKNILHNDLPKNHQTMNIVKGRYLCGSPQKRKMNAAAIIKSNSFVVKEDIETSGLRRKSCYCRECGHEPKRKCMVTVDIAYHH